MQQSVSPPPPQAFEPPPSQSSRAVHPPPPPQAACYSPDPMTLAMAGQSRFLPPLGNAGVDGIAGGEHQGDGADVRVTANKVSSSAAKRKESGAKQRKEQPAKHKTQQQSGRNPEMQRRLLPQPSPQAEQPCPLAPPEGAEDGIAAIAEASSAAKRKESGVNERKEQSAKRFKLPAGQVSPLVPTRSTGIRMMLSPRLDLPSTSGTIDISSSNGTSDAWNNITLTDGRYDSRKGSRESTVTVFAAGLLYQVMADQQDQNLSNRDARTEDISLKKI